MPEALHRDQEGRSGDPDRTDIGHLTTRAAVAQQLRAETQREILETEV
jgi:hypothetical protein